MEPRFVILFAAILASINAIGCNATGGIMASAMNNSCDNGGFPLVSSVNHLSFFIARKLTEVSNNFLYSPLGLSAALGMVYLGAKGQTAKEIEDSLMYTNLGITGIQAHAGMHNLTSDIRARAKDKFTLHLANAIFLREELYLNDSYIRNLETYYDAESMHLDFDFAPITSMEHINEWVKSKTSRRMRKFLYEPVPRDAEVFLGNAIYFKGDWKVEFPCHSSVTDYFFVAGRRSEVTVSMMILSKEKFRYLVDRPLGYKFLELPYKGEQMSMLVALPLQFYKVPDLNMTSEMLCAIRSNMEVTKLDVVAIPRFKIEYERNMKSIFNKLGIVEAFSGSADFSAMKPEGGIHVSDVRHKVVIEVNEQGSEVAAATGVQIMPISALRPPDFVANHSFLFYIIDIRTGLVLFSGRLMEPRISRP